MRALITREIILNSDSLPINEKKKEKTSPINTPGYTFPNLEKKSSEEEFRSITKGRQVNRKRKARGAAINIGSGWFRRGRRKGNLVASSPVSRCHLCVLDSWLRASNHPPPTKGGRRNDERAVRERERKKGGDRSFHGFI